VNRVGTENVVEAMTAHAPSARLVHVSSLAAAGPSERTQGRGPEEAAAPVSSYGRSKLGGEAAAMRFKGPWAVLRPPAVYGPRDIDVLQFFKLVAKGIVPVPAGERWVTVVHVSDVVRAILAATDGRVDGRTLHVGEPSPRRMTQLVADLAEAGGLRARVVPISAALLRTAGLAGDLMQLVGLRDVALTSDKARELCARHWSARTADSLAALATGGFVPFPSGAAQTWAWYRQAGWLPHAKMPPERTAK
jgi:nucleoside-diphosphate-sugar epimerase